MAAQIDEVRVWEETVTIPTYPVGKPDKNPMFLEKRVYQGSSGVVYPHPVIDHVYDEKVDKNYQAIFLENRYLKIMLLPELGGRVQMALDKTNDYHFVYYNRVIKPALVGLAGPWISGGIEFNFPQHHRPGTFEPVDYKIVENADGTKTAWMSDIDRMSRLRGMAGFTLYPDTAYLEIDVRLYNGTSVPQTFLWWANPAVHVNDDYQSIFPPDVHAVMDHGKRDVSTFPIATGTYYKVNYAPGTDISRYKNIPVPTSYMAYHSDFDFLGCYDHGKQAGMMHVANHHTVPGKKQWTWGNSDFGRAWDRQLTDEDGPYIELMCGAYTDNQPDFSWLQPGEEKRFTQVFMPYKQIRGAKNANKDAVINLEIDGQNAFVGVYLTSPRTVRIVFSLSESSLFERTIALTPEIAFMQTVSLPENVNPQDLSLYVYEERDEIISYTPVPDKPVTIPEPAKAAKPPADIASNDELFLNGQHLEQYRHATRDPEAYYLEALRRDSGDYRCNNAMGLLLYRRGKFAEAEAYFRKAIERLTSRNPNPYDGEAYYNLGLALKMQQARELQAFDAFYKVVWNRAWQSSAYFELARLACKGSHLNPGRYEGGLGLVERALAGNAHHHKAWHLKIALLRKLERTDEALQAVEESLKLDCLNFGVLYERHLLTGDTEYRELMRGNSHTYIEIALDCTHGGLYDEALALVKEVEDKHPMARYYRGWTIFERVPELLTAMEGYAGASEVTPDYCFPNELEAVPALKLAMFLSPNDARAPYYLGNFWYAHRCYDDAIECWEKSALLDPNFPTVHRNLGLAYVNKKGDLDAALAAYEKAFELDRSDARVFFELDQLHKKMNMPPAERLARLAQHTDLVNARDDLTLEQVSLLNLTGKFEEALSILLSHRFHPWEGGEGKVTGQYVLSLVELGKQKIAAGDFAAAIDYLNRAQTYPHNLGEGKLPGVQENNIFYYLGCSCELGGNAREAEAYFRRASVGLSEPTSAVYYNDQPPDMIFYQGKAFSKLGQPEQAALIFQKLLDYGKSHLNDEVEIDYFAVSLPDFLVFDEDLQKRHQEHCHYMMALGCLGLGQMDTAKQHFETVLSLNAAHAGATIHKALLAD